MRKRYVAILMAGAIGISLFGCGKTESNNTEKESTEGVITSETVMEDSQEQKTTEAGTEQEQAQSASVGFPYLTITNFHYEAGENAPYISGSYKMAEVTGEDYQELKRSVDAWFETFKKNYEEEAERYIQDAKVDAEVRGEDFEAYSLKEEVKAARLDHRVVSIAMDKSTYSGGVHGYNYLYGVTFDTQTGKELTFESLGDIREEVKTYITTYIEKKRKEGYILGTFEEEIDGKLDNPNWYLSGLGLEFVFNAYDIGSYAEGRTIVTIPYAEMKHFNTDYRLTEKTMFTELVMNKRTEIDIDSDHTADIVELHGNYDEYDDLQLSVKVNDISLDIQSATNLLNAYFVAADNGRNYILVSYDAMSDDYVTDLIEVTDKTPKKLETLNAGGLISMSNDVLGISGNMDVLGTYVGYRTYRFAEGKFEAVEECFTFSDNERAVEKRGPVLKTELTVLLEKNGTMVEQKLQAGTKLYPVNSDGETVVGFRLEDGTYGEVFFQRQDSTIYMDGISEYDIFDELPYAG